MPNETENQYRHVDIEAVYRIIDPLEGEIRNALSNVFPDLDEKDLDEKVAEAMESVVFRALDEFPEVSRLVDIVESRLNGVGVTIYSQQRGT